MLWNVDLHVCTFPEYYNMNCCKCGVFSYTCGWTGIHHLWSGSVADTEYMTSSNILDDQIIFVLDDLVGGSIKPFLNALDEWYMITLECKDRGRKRTSQSDFSKSDYKFRAIEYLSSSAIAKDRSRNKRVIRYLKASGYVRRSKYSKYALQRIGDA